MPKSMVHWNANQLCAIDTETTGLDSHRDEILQIAIVPLDSNIEVRKDVLPFCIYMKPDHPENITEEALKINKLKIEKIMDTGFDKDTALQLLEEWIAKLELPYAKYGSRPKRIIPLGQNYAFDKGFIQEWLGVNQYNEWFDYHYVDTMITANYLNDRAAVRAEKVPFPKVGLAYLANVLKIPHERAHDALQDALVCSQCYRQMLHMGGLLE